MTTTFIAYVVQAARWMVCLSLSVLMLLSMNQALAQGKFIDVTSKVHQKILYGYRDNISILDNSTAAWGDYDNDGLQDFFIIGKESTYRLYAQLYHNTGNGWEDVTEEMIPGLKDITDTDHWAIDYNKGGLALGSVTWVDYNNDKRMDLFLSGNYGFTRSLRYSALFYNTGNGFMDVTKKVFTNDLAQLDHSSVVWGDIDGDGWKDLLMTGSEGIGPSGGLDWLSPAFYCYLNKGGTSFEDAWNENNKRPLNYNWPTRAVGDGSTGVLTLANYTNDSRVGLATNNNGIKTDPDQTTSFYTYDASLIQFIRVQDSDIFRQPNNVPQGGSIAWADYDGDNRIDMFITGFYQGNDPDPLAYVSKLYRNTGQGYEDVTYLLPSLPGLGYSGKVWFDFNKDGRQDLFVSGESNSGTGITKLYMNTVSGFMDVTNQLIPDLRDIAFKSVDTADYDKDGWTDLLLTGSGTTKILHNEVAKPQLGGAEQSLQLIAPLYNCQTGAFTFQTQGSKGSGSPDALIEYMATGITGWTTNPNQFVDFELRQAADAQPITLMARQNGQIVRYVWNIRTVCPVDAPSRLRLFAPLYNCSTGAITFQTQGGQSSPTAPIEYMAAGITGWTTNPNQFVDFELRQAADAQPITLMVRQMSSSGTYVQDRYVWDIRALCSLSSVSTASARLGAAEPGLTFQISVSPNPVDDEFMVLIEGAQQQSVRLLVTDLLGRSLVNKPLLIDQPTHFERVNLSGTGLGVYLLRVSSGQRSRTIKVIKQR